jgi:hypothetical protein
MALFRSQLHQDIWIEHHCKRCHFGQADTMCPILHRALRSNRKPVEWERNTRTGALMSETMKCNTETRQPPTLSRPVVNEDVPMFDVETVDGPMDSDHA